MWWLSIACTPPMHIARSPDPEPDSEAVDESPADTHDSTHDSAPPDCEAPATWVDGLVPVAQVPISSASPHLADGVLAGETLVLVGRDVRGNGAIWSFAVGDPTLPSALGHDGFDQLMGVCWGGESGYAVGLEGKLFPFTLGASGPELGSATTPGGPGTRLDCDGDHVAFGSADRGGGLAPMDDPQAFTRFGDDVRDVLLEGARLWSVGYDGLQAWDIAEGQATLVGDLELPGLCTDLAAGDDWIVASCGYGGVHLIDRADGQPRLLSTWQDWTSPRTVAVAGDLVVVSGWSDHVVLDASDPTHPEFAGSEPAPTAASAAVPLTDGHVALVDWKLPTVVQLSAERGPEVRADTEFVRPGQVVRIHNEGSEDLCLEPPNTGTLDRTGLRPGGSAVWAMPQDLTDGTTLVLRSNDADEPELALQVGGLEGLVVGEAAPDFVETDLSGTTWALEDLRGQVVFLGLLDSW